MSQSKEINQVLGDHALCIRALLPETMAVLCHDEHGEILWQTRVPPGAQVPQELAGVVLELLATSAEPGASRVVGGQTLTAHVMRLDGQQGRAIGTLSVLLDAARTGNAIDVAARLSPALHNLQRDLSLRIRLAEAQRRLAVQAAEEALLHEVEQTVHQRSGCETLLREIVDHCHRHLAVNGVALMLPDKRIRLVQGDAISLQDAERIARTLPRSVDDTGTIDGPADLKAAHGDLLCMPLLQGGRLVTGVLAFAGWKRSGFSERRRARVVRYVASHIEYVINRNYDPLTGLIAWPVFEQQLLAAQGGNSEDSEICTVIYFDIDSLHVVNESMGRDCGDEILTRFAVLARDNFAGHPVSRIASDSFAALLKGIAPEAAQVKAQAICDGFRELVYTRGNQTFRPSVSIGIGLLGATPDQGGPLATAEVACHAAKDRGRGRVELYEDSDQSIVRRLDDIQLVGFVRSSLENDRLHLLAQPIVALRPGTKARYYEILVRMIGAGGKALSPAEFMSTAERYQMMEELDRWVVSRSLDMIGAKSDELHAAELSFAINLSGQSLGSEQFLPFVLAEFERTKVPPSMICFEITESVAVTRMQQAQTLMHTLKRQGCTFALDDFGTGLASFAYLKLFPVDTLKIDGSFIRDVVTNVVSQSMVAAISEVARVMNLETVAEFVQDEAAVRLLRDLGISWAQGYLLGVPEPLERVIQARAIEATASKRTAAG